MRRGWSSSSSSRTSGWLAAATTAATQYYSPVAPPVRWLSAPPPPPPVTPPPAEPATTATAAAAATATEGDEGNSTTAVPGAQQGGDKYVIVYTCKVCNTRAARTITKAAYHHGVVLIRCPGCTNLHLVADHLGYFDDDSVDIERMAAAKGESVRRGRMPASGVTLSSGVGGEPSPAAADPNVLEFSELDRRVLRSGTKAVHAPTGEEVSRPIATTRGEPKSQ